MECVECGKTTDKTFDKVYHSEVLKQAAKMPTCGAECAFKAVDEMLRDGVHRNK